MRIYLPWKRKGYDGSYYQAVLEVVYDHTQNEEMFKKAQELEFEHRQNEIRHFEIKKKSGLRRCPGHKHSTPLARGQQCGVCGGWVY